MSFMLESSRSGCGQTEGSGPGPKTLPKCSETSTCPTSTSQAVLRAPAGTSSHRGAGCPPPQTGDLKQLPVKWSPVCMPQALLSHSHTGELHMCCFGVHRTSINKWNFELNGQHCRVTPGSLEPPSPAWQVTHLAQSVHIVLVSCPGVHIRDGVEQQLCYLDTLLPGKGSCNVEGGQGHQLQRKHRRS